MPKNVYARVYHIDSPPVPLPVGSPVCILSFDYYRQKTQFWKFLHEGFNHSVKYVPIVVALFCMSTEVLYSFWAFIRIEFNVYVSICRVYGCIIAKFDLRYFLLHVFLFELFGGEFIPQTSTAVIMSSFRGFSLNTSLLLVSSDSNEYGSTLVKM